MSLNTIMGAATSGMMTAQTQIRVVSDNVANVNTPGYVRRVVDQAPLVSGGQGMGVEIQRIRLATDRFLQAAGLNASAEAARSGVRADMLDRIQSMFGDPSGASSFFSGVNQIFSLFSSLAEDPSSSTRRQEVLARAAGAFEEASRIYAAVQDARLEADGRIAGAVDTANRLLQQIEALNVEISRNAVAGGDASASESAQAQLIDELAKLMDVRVQQRASGGVVLRTGDGMLLAGEGAATLSYRRTGVVGPQSQFEEIWLTEPRGETRPLGDHLSSGEIKGLLDLRDVEAPATTERLAEMMTRLADELNRAHNAYTAVPAPATLAGRDTGLDLAAGIAGFTGATTLAVVNAAGVIQRRVDIDFGAGTMTVDGAPFGAFTPATFLAQLNAAFGGQASASFANGALSISATAPGAGLSIQDDAANPSRRNGRGFSHHFGLNDMVRSDSIALYDTGLTTTSAHGFAAGGEITFRMTNETGARLRDIAVQIPAGATMADLLAALNSTTTGVGRYGAFALDAAGRLTFTATTSPPARLTVAGDTTERGAGGPSISVLFGLGGVRAGRADGFSIREDLRGDPRRLALASLNLAAPAGASALSVGDGRGALALAQAGRNVVSFEAAGRAAAVNLTLERYFSEFAGDLGADAAAADAARDQAAALADEASSRRASFEGVNLDEELVKMTTYQQAYNASARLILAVKEMYDALLEMA